MSIALSNDAGAGEIHYTTNGSNPTMASPLYATPLGTISGIVVDEDKRPVAAARVSTRAASREGMNFMMLGRGPAHGIYSGPDGRFVLTATLNLLAA